MKLNMCRIISAFLVGLMLVSTGCTGQSTDTTYAHTENGFDPLENNGEDTMKTLKISESIPDNVTFASLSPRQGKS